MDESHGHAARELPLDRLIIVGVNHRSAGASLRERLFVPEADEPQRLAELRAAGIDEAMVLSTCDRVEIVAALALAGQDGDRLRGLLAAWAGLSPAELDGQDYQYRGAEALRHFFAVAASLDSQMIGEPQVLGQVKDSRRRSVAAGMIGRLLGDVTQAAFAAAKRVRRETPLAEQPVTLAAAALRVARDLHGALERCSALVIGLGEMGELLAGELKAAGLRDLALSHRNQARAELAAHRLRCHLRDWDERAAALVEADIVVSAVGAGRYELTREEIQTVLKKRRYRPMFLIDAAVPGDIEAAVQDLDGAFVYDLGDLERVAHQGKEKREAAAIAAWAVLNEELARFERAQAERVVVPALVGLREHAEALRREVLADGKLDAAAATRLLLGRLLHAPSEVLRQTAVEDQRERAALERALTRLFRLHDEKGDKRE
jgi:glutamyl-tRNA reductase